MSAKRPRDDDDGRDLFDLIEGEDPEKLPWFLRGKHGKRPKPSSSQPAEADEDIYFGMHGAPIGDTRFDTRDSDQEIDSANTQIATDLGRFATSFDPEHKVMNMPGTEYKIFQINPMQTFGTFDDKQIRKILAQHMTQPNTIKILYNKQMRIVPLIWNDQRRRWDTDNREPLFYDFFCPDTTTLKYLAVPFKNLIDFDTHYKKKLRGIKVWEGLSGHPGTAYLLKAVKRGEEGMIVDPRTHVGRGKIASNQIKYLQKLLG